MDTSIQSARDWFRDIYLRGIPFLLRQNDTAFLSFLCVVSATDALSGYRYEGEANRMPDFVRTYFPDKYKEHAENLYLFRCRMLHNFSPAHFSVVHAMPELHLQHSSVGDTVLDDGTFFSDMSIAAEKYFEEMEASAELQAIMLCRLQNAQRGGSIFVART
ncbi:MAG TPA: hypothetical protein DHW63_04300 [Hyphomonadaceae bacterium]|nr:hypothetical protein [Hyphomonadaceae bacterium]